MSECARIPLADGKFTMVDAEDVALLSAYNWWDKGNGYVMGYCRDTKAFVLMHRVITGAPKGMDVDHINHDTFDNRRANLRVCTRAENNINRKGANRGAKSPYRGVGWSSCRQAWIATFRNTYLGIGRGDVGEIAMAKLYDKAAKEALGDRAGLNFPEGIQP